MLHAQHHLPLSLHAVFKCLLLWQVGVVDIDPEDVVKKGRLMPGNIFLVDFDEHRVVEDKEMKDRCDPLRF